MARWFGCRRGCIVFGEPRLSSRALELLARERGRVEDDAIKSRALDRARATVRGERPSGVAFRHAAELAAKKTRATLRTVVLIAAATAVAGLAAAGAKAFVWTEPAQVRSVERMVKLPPGPRATELTARGALPQLAHSETAPTPPPTGRRATPPSPAPSSEARALSAQLFAAELAVLEPARRDISRGDYAAALVALSKHRREFPSGLLSEEREALQVRALWGAGQNEAALSAAKVFRQRYPRSVLLSWLKDRGNQAP
jgi:hypothetical protein